MPAAFAFLASTWLPLAIAGALGVYIFDTLQSGGLIPPIAWVRERLGAWFGYEEI